MQQIADWLEKLGMSEYAERFAAGDAIPARAGERRRTPCRATPSHAAGGSR